MTRRLVIADVDAVKEFVFESSRLPQVRGASQILREAEDDAKRAVAGAGASVVYAGGAVLVAECEEERLAEVGAMVQAIFRDRTLGAVHVTVAHEQGAPAAPRALPSDGWAGRLARGLPEEGFGRRLAGVSAHLRRLKDERVRGSIPETLPFGAVCTECGHRHPLATPEGALRFGEEERALCEVCVLRHAAGRRKGAGARGWANVQFEKQHRPVATEPDDLTALVDADGGDRRHVALVYVDGNDVGSLIARARTEDEYRKVSNALEEGSRAATFSVLQEVYGDRLVREGPRPFDIIVLGGDDVMLFCGASRSLEVATLLVERIGREVTSRLPRGSPEATASAGVVVAPVGQPVRIMQQAVQRVLGRAKAVAARERTGAVDLLWMKSGTGEDAHEVGSRVSGKPYSLPRAKQLVHVVHSWPASMAASQARQLAESTLLGPGRSVNFIQYQLARQGEASRRAWSAWLDDVARVAPGTPAGPAWSLVGPGHHVSPLMDVIEVEPLCRKRPSVEVRA